MKKGLVEMVFILDRSGSMAALEADTIGGFNSMIQKQKEMSGEARVTTILFDNKYEVLHNCIDIQSVPKLTSKEYYSRGTTALYDAIGKTIADISHKHLCMDDSEKPEKVIFAITTDGYENASMEYTQKTVKAMIQTQSEKCGWEFLFIAANIDTQAVADDIGIDADCALSYVPSKKGTRGLFDSVCYAMTMARSDNKTSKTERARVMRKTLAHDDDK